MWSTATMVEAPARRAPWITDRPTPPQPMTATVEPGSTPAVCQTAPIPVDKAHPTRAASSRGAARSTGTTWRSGTSVSSAKVAVPSPRMSFAPPTDAYGPPSDSAIPVLHNMGCPARHQKHCRHGGIHVSTTWSPTATRVTAGPTSTTTPEPSWPSTVGNMKGMVPFWTERSEWHTPLAAIRTRTSRGPTGSSVISSTSKGAPTSRSTAARTVPACVGVMTPPPHPGPSPCRCPDRTAARFRAELP